MKAFELHDKTYNIDCSVYIGCSLAELARVTGLKDVSKENAENGELSLGRCVSYSSENPITKNKTTKYIIWLRENDPQVLAHELTHLMIQIFTDKHIPVTLANSEKAARYVDQWYGTIYPKIEKGATLRLPTIIRQPVTLAQLVTVVYLTLGISSLIYTKNAAFLVAGFFYFCYWQWLKYMSNRKK